MNTEPPRRRTILAGLATMVGIFFRGLGGLISVRLCLSFLGREAFAVWVFVQSTSNYFALSEAGVGQATLNQQGKAYAENNFDLMSRTLVSATGLYFAYVSIAGVIAAALFAFAPLESWLPHDISASYIQAAPMYLVVAVTTVLLAVPLTSFAATLSGARFHHIRQSLDAALPAVTVLSLALLLYLGAGLWAAVLVTPVLQIVWGFVYLFAVKKMLPSLSLTPSLFSVDLAKKMMGHSMFFFLIGFCLLGYRALPALLVGRHGSVDEVSQIFALVLLTRALGWSVMDAISRVLQPYIILFEHQSRVDRIEFFTKLAVVATGLAAFTLTTVILCFGNLILQRWLGGTVVLSFGMIAAVALSFMLDVSLLPVFNTLIAMSRHRRLGILMAGQSVLMIVMSEVFARTSMINSIFNSPADGVLAGILIASFVTAVFAGPFVAAPGLQMTFARFARSIWPRATFFVLLAAAAATVLQLLGVGETPYADLGLRLAIFTAALVVVSGITWFALLSSDERAYARSFRKSKISAE